LCTSGLALAFALRLTLALRLALTLRLASALRLPSAGIQVGCQLQCLAERLIGHFALTGDFLSSLPGRLGRFGEGALGLRQALGRLLLGRLALRLALRLTLGLALRLALRLSLRLALRLSLRLSFALRLSGGLGQRVGLLGDLASGGLLPAGQVGQRLGNRQITRHLLLAGVQVGGGTFQGLADSLLGGAGLLGCLRHLGLGRVGSLLGGAQGAGRTRIHLSRVAGQLLRLGTLLREILSRFAAERLAGLGQLFGRLGKLLAGGLLGLLSLLRLIGAGGLFGAT
jgi:hypothetical protein